MRVIETNKHKDMDTEALRREAPPERPRFRSAPPEQEEARLARWQAIHEEIMDEYDDVFRALAK